MERKSKLLRRLFDLLLLRTRVFKEVAEDEGFTRAAWVTLAVTLVVLQGMALATEAYRNPPLTLWVATFAMLSLPVAVLALLAQFWVAQYVAQQAFHGAGGVSRLPRVNGTAMLWALTMLLVLFLAFALAAVVEATAGWLAALLVLFLLLIVGVYYTVAALRDGLGLRTGEAIVTLIAGSAASQLVSTAPTRALVMATAVAVRGVPAFASVVRALNAVVLYRGVEGGPDAGQS